MKTYHVYIVSSISRVIYVGVTSQLRERVEKHKQGVYPESFTKRYRMTRLVYYEPHYSIYDALNREKQIKRWRREKKLQLIRSVNPQWDDLALDYL